MRNVLGSLFWHAMGALVLLKRVSGDEFMDDVSLFCLTMIGLFGGKW